MVVLTKFLTAAVATTSITSTALAPTAVATADDGSVRRAPRQAHE